VWGTFLARIVRPGNQEPLRGTKTR
jgi:hypothetical protein